jgi:hypothetical protein
MESYDIENNMKNKNFVNETNIHPTLSIFWNDINIYIYKLNNFQIISFENFIEH